MALGSAQALTEMSTKKFLGDGDKEGQCVGLTTLPPSCADCLKIWEPQHPGTMSAYPGLYKNCFTFTFTKKNTATARCSVAFYKEDTFQCKRSFAFLLVFEFAQSLLAATRS